MVSFNQTNLQSQANCDSVICPMMRIPPAYCQRYCKIAIERYTRVRPAHNWTILFRQKSIPFGETRLSHASQPRATKAMCDSCQSPQDQNTESFDQIHSITKTNTETIKLLFSRQASIIQAERRLRSLAADQVSRIRFTIDNTLFDPQTIQVHEQQVTCLRPGQAYDESISACSKLTDHTLVSSKATMTCCFQVLASFEVANEWGDVSRYWVEGKGGN